MDYICAKTYTYDYFMSLTEPEIRYDTYLECKQNPDYPADATRVIEPPPERPPKPDPDIECEYHWYYNEGGGKDYYSGCYFYEFNTRKYSNGHWESHYCFYGSSGIPVDEVYDCHTDELYNPES